MKRNQIYLSLSLLLSFSTMACQGSDTVSPLGKTSSMLAARRDEVAGNANQTVFSIDVSDQVTCDNGSVLTRSAVGRIQVHNFDHGNNPNLALDNFQVAFNYTNAAGDSFTWREVGPDRLTVQDGKLLLTVTGRAGGHIGTFTIDPTTGAVLFSAGQDLGSPDAQACAQLG